jgi:hypothetical protein
MMLSDTGVDAFPIIRMVASEGGDRTIALIEQRADLWAIIYIVPRQQGTISGEAGCQTETLISGVKDWQRLFDRETPVLGCGRI